MTIKDTDLAWAAGFFDGEGYVTIGRRNHKGYIGHYLRVGVNHVAPEPIVKLHELFGGKVEYTDKVVGNRKPRYRWILNTRAANEFLTTIKPYLINKIKEAELADTFQSSINPKNSKTLSEEVHVFREQLKQELMSMNRDS